MLEQIINYLSGLPKELVVIIIATLPIAELRGAIPVAYFTFKFDIVKSFILAVIGNSLFIIPFLWFLNNLNHYFMRISWYNKFFTWWFNRVKARSKNIEKLEFWGLAVFVGIPLPITGAWSGCVAGYLLGMNFWKAVVACLIGVLIAGIVVTITTIGVTQFIKLF